jgi:hypothetical protein
MEYRRHSRVELAPEQAGGGNPAPEMVNVGYFLFQTTPKSIFEEGSCR